MGTTHAIATVGGRKLVVDETLVGSGAMKDVYLSADGTEVLGVYRAPLGDSARDRLDAIVQVHRPRIFETPEGAYWEKIFCWPSDLVEVDGRVGIVMPAYDPVFSFAVGSRNGDMLGLKGREKEGKWFASPKHRSRHLAPEELGDWRSHLSFLIKVARGVRRLHMAGLAHSDLSYGNVLVDPITGRACIIDLDGLVVPGKYPPEVAGTPDFIAPEVLETAQFAKDDPGRVLPSSLTDRHALAVLVYQYLLYRHPLRGRRIHDPADPARDEQLRMGSRALYIEHSTDRSNVPGPDELTADYLPWADPGRVPASACGPELEPLFRSAFETALHAPRGRPSADDWERALVRTVDRLRPCANSECGQRWYPWQGRASCPFCGTSDPGGFPVLELYSTRGELGEQPDGEILVAYDGLQIYPWHLDRALVPNEKLPAHLGQPVAWISFHRGEWVLVNRSCPQLRDESEGVDVPFSGMVRLTPGRRVRLSGGDGGRSALVRWSEGE